MLPLPDAAPEPRSAAAILCGQDLGANHRLQLSAQAAHAAVGATASLQPHGSGGLNACAGNSAHFPDRHRADARL